MCLSVGGTAARGALLTLGLLPARDIARCSKRDPVFCPDALADDRAATDEDDDAAFLGGIIRPSAWHAPRTSEATKTVESRRGERRIGFEHTEGGRGIPYASRTF